jgi:hypothetical protein
MHNPPRNGADEEAELGAFTIRARDLDAATHALRKLVADKQPQARPAKYRVRHGRRLGEALEEAFELGRRQARSGIAH